VTITVIILEPYAGGTYIHFYMYPSPIYTHTGVGQGIRRSLFSIAAILGPLWAGGAVAFDTYYVLLGVPLGLLLLLMVWVHVHCSCGMVLSLTADVFLLPLQILIALSFSRLKERRQSSLFLS